MKIGEQAADEAKLESWIDEEIRGASARADPATVLEGHGFECPRRRRADRNHRPALVERSLDRGGGVFPNLEPLRLERVLFNHVDAYGLERAIADVKRNLGDLDLPI